MQEILKLSQSFFKFALLKSILLYHGTDGTNLSKILSQGLKKFRADRTSPSAVFLTPSLEAAARYALFSGREDHFVPIILEIVIAGEKRVKKLREDPLDQEDEWYDDSGDIGPTDTMENILLLKRQVEDILGFVPDSIENRLNHAHKDEDMIGYNIYADILFAAREEKLNIQEIKKKMFNKMLSFGNLDLAQNGTFIASKEHLENLHQEYYPKNVPSNAIKAVWVGNVPENLRSGKETKQIAAKLLPGELKVCFEHLKQIVGKYSYKEDLNEDLDSIIEDIEEEDLFNLFADVINDLKVIKNTGVGDIKEVLFSLEAGVDDSWGTGIYKKSIAFVKMKPQEALNYIQSKTSSEIQNYIHDRADYF